MTEAEPIPDPSSGARLEDLVQAHLLRRAATIPTERLEARLGISLTAARRGELMAAADGGLRFRSRVAWGTAAAAALLLAFLGGLQLSPVRAGAETLIQQAHAAHLMPMDRCYLVEVRRDSPSIDKSATLTPTPPRIIRLWTRGDRIWIESVQPQRTWAWGRDDHGNVWMAFGRHRAIRFQRDEVPQWLALGCDIFAMRVETLLNDVLRDFELQRTADGAGMPATQVVTAALKPGHSHPSLRQARIEIDAETKVIRRLVLIRTRLGQPFATITYTLVESHPQDDSQYVLEGHLVAPFDVFTPTNNPEQCRETLERWFDPRNGETFHLPNPVTLIETKMKEPPAPGRGVGERAAGHRGRRGGAGRAGRHRGAARVLREEHPAGAGGPVLLLSFGPGQDAQRGTATRHP